VESSERAGISRSWSEKLDITVADDCSSPEALSGGRLPRVLVRGDGGSVLLRRYIRDCGGGQSYRCRAVLLYTQRRLLMWKQTDKSPFRDITINYFKWS
jgi:hypothetical protein